MKVLTEIELAERWSVTVKMLQDWRRLNKGISYLKIGKSVRYPISVIEQYEKDNMKNGGANE
jgi:predicted transcriptional regulator